MAHGVDPLLAPRFTDAQWARLTASAEPLDGQVGEVLVASGERDYPMILVETGKVDVVRDAVRWAEEELLGTMKERTIVGELGLLNAQALPDRAGLRSRADVPLVAPGTAAIMNEDDELCDMILHALWGRREVLRNGSSAATLKLVGEENSSSFLALRRVCRTPRPRPHRPGHQTRRSGHAAVPRRNPRRPADRLHQG